MSKRKKSFFSKVIYWTLFAVFVYFGVNALSYADTLKFAHISDVHLSDKTVDTSYKVLSHSKELFKDEIEQINSIPNLDFVIVTGDLADKPQKPLLEQACDQMNKLKSPWYFAFGNHDAAVGTSFKKDKYFDYIKKRNKNIKSETSYYSFVPKKGYRVIVLDATIDNRITANGELPKEQLEWLDEQLDLSQKSNQVPLIFLHHPLHEPFPSFHHRLINAQEFKNILDKYNMPIAVFSGHYHATKIYKEGHILHVSTPSLVTYPCAFRIVSVSNMKHQVVFNFDYRETNLKDVQKKAKLLTFSSETYKGEDSDRNGIVIIEK